MFPRHLGQVCGSVLVQRRQDLGEETIQHRLLRGSARDGEEDEVTCAGVVERLELCRYLPTVPAAATRSIIAWTSWL